MSPFVARSLTLFWLATLAVATFADDHVGSRLAVEPIQKQGARPRPTVLPTPRPTARPTPRPTLRPTLRPTPPPPVVTPNTPNGSKPPIPGRFHLPPFNVATPNQTSTSQCWKFAATGTLEYLANQAACREGKVHGPGDFSERYFSTAFNASNWGVTGYFTDGPLAARKYGVVRDSDLPYDGRMGSLDTATMSRLPVQNEPPPFKNQVLFKTPQRDWNDIFQPAVGVGDKEIDQIKAAMIAYQGPVLFTYRPRGVDYWHTALIVGWDESGFILQDSAFGKDVPGTADANGLKRKSETRLSFGSAKQWAKHASIHYLEQMPAAGCGGLVKARDKRYESYLAGLSPIRAMEEGMKEVERPGIDGPKSGL